MADVTTDDPEERGAIDGPRSRGVALADESPDELPALLAIAVGVAVIAIAIVWPSIRDLNDRDGGETAVAAVEEVEDAEPEADAEPEQAAEEPEPEAEPEGPDLERFRSELAGADVAGLSLSADGNIVTVVGEVPDAATRDEVVAYLSGQPNVDGVNAEGLVVVAPAVESDVTVEAAQVSLVLRGTVPDEATRDELVARAVQVYSAAQVVDELVIDPNATRPVTVTISGAMTDPVLFAQVTSAFDGIDGVEVGELAIVLEESGALESSLNGLDPIEFASGSALVQEASEPILDEAAAFLIDNPDVAVEIGGHTDSRGSEESNQALSQARADSVLAALEARGVTNPMTAVGFGERRLKVNPDDTAEARQMNRRIEFRVLS